MFNYKTERNKRALCFALSLHRLSLMFFLSLALSVCLRLDYHTVAGVAGAALSLSRSLSGNCRTATTLTDAISNLKVLVLSYRTADICNCQQTLSFLMY